MEEIKKYYDPMDSSYYEAYTLEYTTDSVEKAIKFVNEHPVRQAVKGFDGGVVWYNSNGTRMVCNTGYTMYRVSKNKFGDVFIVDNTNNKYFEDMLEV